MIQIEHCPEVDDARTFEVEFESSWEQGQSPLIVNDIKMLGFDIEQGDMEA